MRTVRSTLISLAGSFALVVALGGAFTSPTAMASDTSTDNKSAWPSRWEPTGRAAEQPRAAMVPNESIFAGLVEQNNVSIAYHEALQAEVYAVFNNLQGPFGLPPSRVFQAGTPMAGSGVPWFVFGQVPGVYLPEAWNPTIDGNRIPPVAYYMAKVEWVAPALTPGSQSAIVAMPSLGTAQAFPTGGPPAVVAMSASAGTWLDYPYLVVNNVAGNPGPPGLGDIHVAWVQYAEGGDGDPNLNGIFYDDPADTYRIFVASSNTVGPTPYPAFTAPIAVAGGSVMPLAHQTHRPSLAVVGPAGTLPPVALPPGGVYVAWVDGVAGVVRVDASPAPGLGAPWGILGALAAAPVVPLPFMLNGAVKAASTVSIAIDNGPLFPGRIYLAWADYSAGDADIHFSFSANGGTVWTPPMRVNQDVAGNGCDQWAPHISVIALTGDIMITYYDRRRDPANNLGIETWASLSANGGATWNDLLVSDAGRTPPACMLPPVGPALYLGDYLSSDANPVNKWGAAWNDGRNGGDQDAFFELTARAVTDRDADGIPDLTDNCPGVYNPNQAFTITLTGDVNWNGIITSADIIGLVNYVFKSGAAPLPCVAAGDANCSGTVTSSDIIYLVNYVFKSGPLPCNVCNMNPAIWTCP